MSDVSGVGPLSPRDKKMYEQEYKQGADLFKHALNQYNKSGDMFQKEEFKKVMDQAMQVLNESANGLMRKELQKQNSKIASDYATFQKYPGDKDTVQTLIKDLDSAKKSVD